MNSLPPGESVPLPPCIMRCGGSQRRALPRPHGYIMVIGNSEYICTDCQGGTPTNPVDLLGDQIIVMDNNMNVVWTWDAFTFLDVNHPATLEREVHQPCRRRRLRTL